ncbi:MAG: CBS domain-containing protein, partial [Magnetospirillum sp.]
RHLPVTGADGQVIGIVTESDYIRTLGTDYYVRLKDVASVMAPVMVLDSAAPLSRALELLSRSDVSCVVMAGSDGTCGIITERDVVRLLRDGVDPVVTAVMAVMTAPVVTVAREASLLDASEMLSVRRIRRVVVVDGDGRPVGILTQHEIVKGLESEYIGHLEGVVAEKNQALDDLNEVRQILEEQSRLLRRTLDELSVAHAELREFTKIAAHDLQEPLRTVLINCQLLERECGDGLAEPARGHLGQVVDGAGRARLLVGDLVTYFGTMDAAERLEPVDAGEAARSALALLGGKVDATAAEVETGTLPVVPATRAMLVEIFSCLLGNALKFRRPDQAPRIRVEAVAEAAVWHFTVSDNGIGIESEYLDQVFGLFTRLHPVAAYPGSGVGLAICRRLVGLLGGRIWVESAPGHGCRFHFTLARPSG